MNAVTCFNFNGSEIRTLTLDNGEVGFVGKDVAERLGYADTSQAIRQHCRGASIQRPILDALGRLQPTRILTEPDVLRLIVSSTLPEAEAFERWVFEEVLPSVRKTGVYAMRAPASAPAPVKDFDPSAGLGERSKLVLALARSLPPETLDRSLGSILKAFDGEASRPQPQPQPKFEPEPEFSADRYENPLEFTSSLIYRFPYVSRPGLIRPRIRSFCLHNKRWFCIPDLSKLLENQSWFLNTGNSEKLVMVQEPNGRPRTLTFCTKEALKEWADRSPRDAARAQAYAWASSLPAITVIPDEE